MARRPDFRPSQPSLWAEEWFTPDEVGWVRVGILTWEKPNGEYFMFDDGAEQLICKPIWDDV